MHHTTVTRRLINSVFLILVSTSWALSGDPSRETPQALVDAGHWKRARAILEPRVATNPQDAQAAYLLSQVKMTFEDFDGALSLAQRAVELGPKQAEFHYQLAAVYGEMAARVGVVSGAGLVRKFKKELASALALDPHNLDALEAQMEFYYHAPWIVGGDKAKAQAVAEEITRLRPSRGYLEQAELAQDDGNKAALEGLYLKAVQADPGNFDAQTSLADFYSRPPQNRFEQATRYAWNAIHLDPDRAGGYALLARVLARQQRWKELDALLAQASARASDDLAPYYESANALLESGRELSRAETSARKYLSQEPEGEKPNTADAHRLLGLILEKQGRVAEARNELMAAVRLRPGFQEAKDDLKRLGSQGK
ncbi:MAG: tetratricopeptide repeat protein [Acidobacteriia bacterium]|nr:tetratricopeptide repeat protein [Terriglobia bacterium]